MTVFTHKEAEIVGTISFQFRLWIFGVAGEDDGKQV